MQYINIKASFFAMDGNSTVGSKTAITENLIICDQALKITVPFEPIMGNYLRFWMTFKQVIFCTNIRSPV